MLASLGTAALVQLRDPDGSFTDEVKEITEDAQELSDEQDNSAQQFAIWLYNCVKVTGLLAEETEAALTAA